MLFRSSVELATEVNWIDQCQKTRSPANAVPAKSMGIRCGPMKLFSFIVFNEKNNIHSKGTARQTRQNALAVGPTSDTRTQIGDSAMQVAPANSAISAGVRMRRW